VQDEEIYSKLSGVFRDVFAEDHIVITAETTARDVEGWDSLAHVRLMLTIERVFVIKFSAYEVNQLNNVGQLVSLIQTKSSRT
jgi:acyl carrier protein